MASLKFKIWSLLASLKNAVLDWHILILGQSSDFEILQTCHRLEKGLLIKNPRKLWGWDKANRILELVNYSKDPFVLKTAFSVISAYISSKINCKYKEDVLQADKFIKNHNFSPNCDEFGGVKSVSNVFFNDYERSIISKLFISRHSTRTFSDEQITEENIREAIKLALRCPSACNRQPYKIYVVSDTDKEKYIAPSKGYSGKCYLFITGMIDAYTLDEVNDWIVSPSIFAGYLTLSLHSLGIGSCVVRKDLISNSEYNKKIREFCKIPRNEKIILEMAIGHYLSENLVPISNRRDIDECYVLCH